MSSNPFWNSLTYHQKQQAIQQLSGIKYSEGLKKSLQEVFKPLLKPNKYTTYRNKYTTYKNELVLYALIRDDLNLDGGEYLSYVSSCIFEKIFRNPGLIKHWLNSSANIVYLYADGYKMLCNAMKFAGTNNIPFTPIYKTAKQQLTKDKSMIGIFLGPVKRRKAEPFTRGLQLF